MSYTEKKVAEIKAFLRSTTGKTANGKTVYKTDVERYQTAGGNLMLKAKGQNFVSFMNNRAKDASTISGKKWTALQFANACLEADSIEKVVKLYKKDVDDTMVARVIGTFVRGMRTAFDATDEFLPDRKQVLSILHEAGRAWKGTTVRVKKQPAVAAQPMKQTKAPKQQQQQQQQHA